MKKKNIKYLVLIIIPTIVLLVTILFLIPTDKLKQPLIVSNKKIVKSEKQNKAKKLAGESIQKLNLKPIDKSRNKVNENKISLKSKDTIKSIYPDSSILKESTPDTLIFSSRQENINKIEEAPPVLSEMPTQTINQGEKFVSIDLNKNILNPKENAEKIKWEISGYKNLKFYIDQKNLLIVELPNDDWYGVDTLTLTAYNKPGSSSTTKIIFEVIESELINRYPIKPVKDILITGVEDVLSFAANPLQWETDDIINAATVVIGTVLLTTIDTKVKESVARNDNYENNALLNFGKFYGETSTSQYTALGVTLCGIAANDKKIVRLGLEIFESYLLSDRLTFLLKHIFGRDRPSADNGNLNFKPFSGRSNLLNALPSGHATLAFSLSTVLSSYTESYYLKSIIFAPAVITVISRIYQNYHWASDVFLGGAIGYVVGSFLVNRHNKIFSDKISLGFDQQGRIGFIYNF